jgi:hypothetical protein
MMARYRTINVDLNRQYRNDLNANFAQIEQDIIGQESFTVEMKNSLLTELARIEQESIDRDNTLARQNLEVLLQSIEDAKANANTAASNANTKATHAQTQGDYAKEQGDFAKLQGEYAQTKGDYADEKAILADQAAGNANFEAGNLSQLKVDVVTATQNANTATDGANTATTNANDSATYATEQGDFAKTQGNYANEKGLLAHNEASNLSQLKADAQTATTNANTAASNANAEASNLSTLKSEVQTATINANTATSNSLTQANHAKTHGDYAKNQGSYAKQQGDIIQDILDQGTVASVNGQTGTVVLKANHINITDSANHFSSTHIEGALNELFTNVSDGKTQIATAITDKGITASGSDTFTVLSNKIMQIQTGYSLEEMIDAGVSVETLLELGYTKADFEEIGIYLDSTGYLSPAPIRLQQGDLMAGYYGKTTGLITGNELFAKTGLTAGTTLVSGDITWLKFSHNYKTLFVADRGLKEMVVPSEYQVQNLVKGKPIEINGKYYLCRLMTGGNSNPASSIGGEWNDLITRFTPTDGESHWYAKYTVCQEIGSSTDKIIGVGYNNAKYVKYDISTNAYGPIYQFRPVLEVL